jgi:poly(A) polymerase
MAALTADGSQARFVGGCVRDAVLNRPIHDIDIATPNPPEKVMELLAKQHIKALPTGITHGTVTALCGNRSFEITTLRRDVKTDGRHAHVAYTKSWREDAARRDFTINTLSADLDGRIWDPFNGLADLGSRHVRFVGDPETRIAEDILRILRFFRFHATFGLGAPDWPGLIGCRKKAHRLVELSSERIAAELMKLLAATDPSPVVTLMKADGFFKDILPEVEFPDRLKVLIWLESRALIRPHISPDPIRRLACLLPPDAKAAQKACRRLHFSNEQTTRVKAIAHGWTSVHDDLDEKTTRRLLHWSGADLFRDHVLVAWSDQRRIKDVVSSALTARWTGLLDRADTWTPVQFPLRGQDALDLGVPAGPLVGSLLAQVESWWEDLDYHPDHRSCLKRLESLLTHTHN